MTWTWITHYIRCCAHWC